MNPRLAADIELLIKLFKEKGWTELRLQVDDLDLLLSSDAAASSLKRAPTAPTHSRPAAPPAIAASKPTDRTPAAAPKATEEAAPVGWMAIRAPSLGTFYRSPKPGAAPFVELGQTVGPDTDICLLEVMKLFTSVKAGASGVVRRICASDAELVEGGQVLFYVEPA